MEVENHTIHQNDAPKEHPLRYKSYWHVMLVVLNLSLSNFYFGYALVYISTMQFQDTARIFKVTFQLETARGVLTGCISIGAGLGALLGRKLIHVFSRRNLVIFINMMALISGSFIYITEMQVFIAMRLIQGICVGLYTSVVPLIITEISPVEMSGSTGPLTQIFCSAGTTLAYLIFYILDNVQSLQSDSIWYFVFGFPLIPIIVQTFVLIFVFPYETPKYYLLNDDHQKAKILISELYKEEYVEQVYKQKVQDLQNIQKKSLVRKNSKVIIQNNKVANQSNQNMNIISKPMQQISNKQKKQSKLVSKNSISIQSQKQQEEPETTKVAIFASLHLNILRQFVGINVVILYGGNIIKEAVPELRTIVPVFLNFLAMIGAISTIYLLGRIGRKTMLQGGTCILTISLGLITLGFFLLENDHTVSLALILTGLIIYMAVFGATLGSVIWLYISQIVEPSYIIFATMITWIFASIVTIVFPIFKKMLPEQNPSYLFLFFFLWTGLSFFANHIVLVETHNRTEHQIHEQYAILEKKCFCPQKKVIDQENQNTKKQQQP